MSELVTCNIAEGVASITMDDGKANALSLAMFAQLSAALDQAQAEGASVLLAGRAGVFSAGFHLPTLMGGGADARAMLSAGFELSRRLLSFPTPVIVACTGHAIAMGLFLVLCADYRVGAQGPFKLMANEVAIGLTLPRTALEICRQRLAPSHFGRVTLLSETYPPEVAVEAGILDRAVPAGHVLDVASAFAAQTVQLNRTAHAASKLRARAPTLQALDAALQADLQDFGVLR